MNQAFLLQGLHGRPSNDELLESVLHATPVGAVRGAVFQLGAAEHIWRRRRGQGSDRVIQGEEVRQGQRSPLVAGLQSGGGSLEPILTDGASVTL